MWALALLSAWIADLCQEGALVLYPLLHMAPEAGPLCFRTRNSAPIQSQSDKQVWQLHPYVPVSLIPQPQLYKSQS